MVDKRLCTIQPKTKPKQDKPVARVTALPRPKDSVNIGIITTELIPVASPRVTGKYIGKFLMLAQAIPVTATAEGII